MDECKSIERLNLLKEMIIEIEPENQACNLLLKQISNIEMLAEYILEASRNLKKTLV
ncbi:MAG: hypothetical protein ACRCU6_12575 [Fusobacteriaceae bacterium]